MRLSCLIIFFAMACHAQGKAPASSSTNKPPAAIEAKEKKAEHQANKIIVKSRPKGSKKESDWQTKREYPLMFANNRKAKKGTQK